jgi:hypothetical protein
LIAAKDTPNFVEMSNIYYAMRALPRGSFPPSFTKTLVRYSLELMPTYHRDMFPLLLGAIAKVDYEEPLGETATLLDLAMRQQQGLEVTKMMRFALRAISNLPATTEANQTFATFLEYRHNLEEPMDLGALDETTDCLRLIVDHVLTDPGLSQEAKELAKSCALRAVNTFKQMEASDNYSKQQLTEAYAVVARIVDNYTKI